MVETVSDGGGGDGGRRVEDGACDGRGGSGLGMMEVAGVVAMGRISGGDSGNTCNCGGDGGRREGDGGKKAGGGGSSDADYGHRWRWLSSG